MQALDLLRAEVTSGCTELRPTLARGNVHILGPIFLGTVPLLGIRSGGFACYEGSDLHLLAFRLPRRTRTLPAMLAHGPYVFPESTNPLPMAVHPFLLHNYAGPHTWSIYFSIGQAEQVLFTQLCGHAPTTKTLATEINGIPDLAKRRLSQIQG